MNKVLYLSFSTTQLFQNLPLMMIRSFLHSQFVLILHLPQHYPLPCPCLMFTLIYFGSAIISPHSVIFNRLKQWKLFLSPFHQTGSPLPQMFLEPSLNLFQSEFLFLEPEWLGWHRAIQRRFCLTSCIWGSHFFNLFHCHITPMAQLSHAYLNSSIFFFLDDL